MCFSQNTHKKNINSDLYYTEFDITTSDKELLLEGLISDLLLSNKNQEPATLTLDISNSQSQSSVFRQSVTVTQRYLLIS